MLFQEILSRVRDDFTKPSGFYWTWLVIYAVAAVALSIHSQRVSRAKVSLLTALKNCFPRRVYLSSSQLKTDIALMVISKYTILVSIGYFVTVNPDRIQKLIAPLISENLLHFFGQIKVPASNGFWIDLGYTFLMLVMVDLGKTVNHVLFHKVPWLWEFHKVHHSGTTLNLFTKDRVHPVEYVVDLWMLGAFSGVFIGATTYFLGFTPSVVTLLGASAIRVVLSAFQLFRHSHLWISFGPFDYVLSSPAQHHIHHSKDPKHFDKNFASYFSFIDLLFGTLYVPKEREDISFGISDSEWGNKRFDSVFGNLFHPFIPSGYLRQRKSGKDAESDASEIRAA